MLGIEPTTSKLAVNMQTTWPMRQLYMKVKVKLSHLISVNILNTLFNYDESLLSLKITSKITIKLIR